MNEICEQSSASYTFTMGGADAGTVQEDTRAFSEVAPIKVIQNQTKKDQISITVDLEKENLAIGTARYSGARHLNKNLAIKPTVPGNWADVMVHGNIEVHMKVNGKEVRMTNRDIRYWPLKPGLGRLGTSTVNGKIWRLGDPDPVFTWDRAGAKDAPGFEAHLAGGMDSCRNSLPEIPRREGCITTNGR